MFDSTGGVGTHLKEDKDAAKSESECLFRYHGEREQFRLSTSFLVRSDGCSGKGNACRRTLRPFLTKTPTQIPLTVPKLRSRMLTILSASVSSASSGDTANGVDFCQFRSISLPQAYI